MRPRSYSFPFPYHLVFDAEFTKMSLPDRGVTRRLDGPEAAVVRQIVGGSIMVHDWSSDERAAAARLAGEGFLVESPVSRRGLVAGMSALGVSMMVLPRAAAAASVNATANSTPPGPEVGSIDILSGATKDSVSPQPTYIRWNGNGSFRVNTGAVNVDYLIVGGGGAGVSNLPNGASGGGGGGQVIVGATSLAAQSYWAFVGSGGDPASATQGGDTFVLVNPSEALVLQAKGGTGGSGANGGNSGQRVASGTGVGEGALDNDSLGGGGGGQTADGGRGSFNPNVGGSGGAGLTVEGFGSTLLVGGGGGGGNAYTTGTGGEGVFGGGNGGRQSAGTAGTANSGGGGGGGTSGGSGGSGLVILKVASSVTVNDPDPA